MSPVCVVRFGALMIFRPLSYFGLLSVLYPRRDEANWTNFVGTPPFLVLFKFYVCMAKVIPSILFAANEILDPVFKSPSASPINQLEFGFLRVEQFVFYCRI